MIGAPRPSEVNTVDDSLNSTSGLSTPRRRSLQLRGFVAMFLQYLPLVLLRARALRSKSNTYPWPHV
ncbi:hypothetical protein BJV78DRAFT_1189171 [Lactifluus subvellereus]|nr:hypothetical protein BJV78DRAFT_1189171 [Lactifluus subvellereus]